MVVAGVLGDVSHCACQKCVAFDLGIRGQQVFLFLALSISALKLMKHEEHEEEEDPLSGRCWLLRSGPQR